MADAVRGWLERRPLRATAVVIALAMFVMITRGHRASSGDAAHYLVIADSVARDGDLAVENNYGEPLVPDVEPGQHARVGRLGILRPVHDIGLPLLAAPFYAAAHAAAVASEWLPAGLRARAKLTPSLVLRQLMSVLMIAVTSGLAMLVVRGLIRESVPPATAAMAGIVWALSPPVLSHGFIFMTEIPTAAAVLALFLARTRLASAGAGRVFVIGVATGALLVLHARNVGLAAGIAFVHGAALRKRGTMVGVYGAGLAAGLGIKFGLSVWFWGGLVSPHEQVGAWSGSFSALAGELVIRSAGLLTDSRHGLLWSAPLYLLLPGAWWLLRRRSPALARDLALVGAAYLLFVLLPMTNVHGWRGGWSPAARFLAPLSGLAVICAAGLSGVRAYWTIGLVLVAQTAVSLIFWLEPAILWSEGPGPALHLIRMFGRTAAAAVPAVDHLTAQLGVWTAAWIGLTALVTWRLVRNTPPRISARAAASVAPVPDRPY